MSEPTITESRCNDRMEPLKEKVARLELATATPQEIAKKLSVEIITTLREDRKNGTKEHYEKLWTELGELKKTTRRLSTPQLVAAVIAIAVTTIIAVGGGMAFFFDRQDQLKNHFDSQFKSLQTTAKINDAALRKAIGTGQ